MDSIRSPQHQTLDIPNVDRLTPSARSDTEPSPTTRRNRDLAHALFGVPDRSIKESTQFSLTDKPVSAANALEQDPSRLSPTPDSSDSSAESTEVAAAPQNNPQPALWPTNGGHSSKDPTDLVLEVQRKADAAMMALQRSPTTQVQVQRGGVAGSLSRRRISPGQISTPRLVSASTSVDTIPLRSPSVASGSIQASSKLGQRFRKLRGTLRAKPPVSYTEDFTSDAPDAQSPLSSQMARYDPASLTVPGAPTISSATEMGADRFPIPSPPASAGPGLRGFMARFRKHRTIDMSQEPGLRGPFQSPPSTPLGTASGLRRNATVSHNTEPERDDTSSQWHSLQQSPLPVPAPTSPAPMAASPPGGGDGYALKQLFAAANDLGLDQTALNDLLARSGSLRSPGWSAPSSSNGATTNGITESSQKTQPARALSPNPADGRPSTDSRPDDNIVQRPVQKNPDHIRRPRPAQDGDAAAVNAIVRRTIIFPSESKSSTIDLNILMRKPSQSTRHRRSMSSHSSRSVHDRAPTPPPPRSSMSKRFSTDNSPPVPQLPFPEKAANRLVPAPIEKSNSTYDSLYVKTILC